MYANVPLLPVPELLNVNIAPAASTVSTVIVISFVGVAPPTRLPSIFNSWFAV